VTKGTGAVQVTGAERRLDEGVAKPEADGKGRSLFNCDQSVETEPVQNNRGKTRKPSVR